MTLRRWMALAGLVGMVAWLHGWGAMRWGQAAATSPAAAPARPAPVQVVWRAAPPEAGSPQGAWGDALPPPAAAQPPARMRPAATPATHPLPGAAPEPLGAQAAAPQPADPQAPSPLAPALPLTEPNEPLEPSVSPQSPAAPAPDVVYAVAATELAAAAAPLPADRPRPTVPTYRTRIPAAATVSYRMSRSGIAGTGELDWRPDGSSYTLRLEGQLPLIGTLITQTSRGRFDAAGLAPERFTDKRLRRGEQAANFQRAEGTVSFSGQSPDVPLTAGVQDRLSVMVQLAAIAAAWSKPPAVGTRLQVRVIGARGDANVWSLRFEGDDTVATPDGAVPALHFQREGDSPNDTRAEFWLDPARSHLPVRVRITDGGSDPFELLRLK